MTKPSNLKTLQQELQQALSLINDYSATSSGTHKALLDTEGLSNTQSLLERCAAVVRKNGEIKPKIRIIRHLACSGGTLLSKCIAAMPNVYLLSELHPTTTLHQGGGKAKFLPLDVSTQARYAKVPDVQSLTDQIFTSNIIRAHNHVQERGGELVIRAHSHSDYCVGSAAYGGCAVSKLLDPHFEVLSIASLRDPIDAYLSLQKKDWLHFQPNSFEEYCRRVKRFIEDQDLIFSYESFVREPEQQMKAITSSLELPYHGSFVDTFGVFNVSGDSGRSGDVIAERTRQEIPVHLKHEIGESQTYPDLVKIMKSKELVRS